MKIKQFKDENLAHFSYAILSKNEIALIDPARDPQPYYDFAQKNKAKIIAVLETHPHADFVSSHKEIHDHTGATIYVSKLVNASYEHEPFDDGDALVLGDITLQALNTPGHSPDSISIVAIDEKGQKKAVFTGDTLFIGDCGRPDLREKAGAITATREELAKQMFHSLHEKLMTLPDDVLVYPAHGAGSLCGKALSDQNSSSIGAEKQGNWSLKNSSEADFVKEILADQPFVPAYFPYDVEINKTGATPYKSSIAAVEKTLYDGKEATLDPSVLIIDTRSQQQFKTAHLKNAVNLMDDTKFETWLGSIIKPKEPFYLIAGNESTLNKMIERSSKIGYETQIKRAFVSNSGNEKMKLLQAQELDKNENAFTILDVRSKNEVETAKFFRNSIHIPLNELRDRIKEIPLTKPIVVHCAGGYRSAAASSLIKTQLGNSIEVFDLGENINFFTKRN